MPPNPRRVRPGVDGTATRSLEDYVRRLEKRVDAINPSVTSDDVANESGVSGDSVTEALDQLDSDAAAALAAANAHHTRHESGGADAIKLDDLAAPDDNTDLNVSTSKHGLAPKGTSGSTQFWRQDWTLAPVGGAAAITSERWAKPSSAHASDEEFDSSTNNFTLYDSSGSAVAGEPQNATIDPYTNDSTHHHVDVNSYRADWMTIKARSNNSRFYYMKPFTPATNVCCYTRVALKSRFSSSDNEDDVGLMLMAATSGHPDPNNRIELIYQQMSTGQRYICRITSGGVDNTVATSTSFGNEQEPPPFLNIHKIGTTYHFWISGLSGHRSYGGNGTFSGTIAYVGFLFQCNGGTPGNGFNQIDFLRFVDSATFLP